MSEKNVGHDIEGLSQEPVDVIAAKIGEGAAPEGVDPAVIAQTTDEIVEAARKKYQAAFEVDAKDLQEKAEARQAELLKEGLEAIGAARQGPAAEAPKGPAQEAPKAASPEVHPPVDQRGDPGQAAEWNNILLGQMVWQLAVEQNRGNEGQKAVAKKLGKSAKDVLPLTTSNVVLSADVSKVVIDAYPDLAAKIWEASRLFPGREIAKQAELGEDVTKVMKQDEFDFLALTELHDAVFEVKGPSLVERLKAQKPAFDEAVDNDVPEKDRVSAGSKKEVALRAVKWGLLVASCATGGIVAKAGVKGVSFLAENLAQNPKVQALAKTLGEQSIKFVSETFSIPEDKVRAKVEHAKGVAEAVSNSKWGMLGKAAAMVGLAVALGNIDFIHDAAVVVAEHTASAAHGVLEVASVAAGATGEFVAAGGSQILHGAAVAGEFVATGGGQILHGAAVAGEYVADAGSQVLHSAAVAAGAPGQFVAAGVGQIVHGAAVAAAATGEFVATGAGQIAHGVAAAASATGDVIVDAGHATVEAAGIVKDGVVEGAHATVAAAAATKDFVVDAAHSAGTHTAEALRDVANAVDPSAAVTEQVASAAERTGADLGVSHVGGTSPVAMDAPATAAPAPAPAAATGPTPDAPATPTPAAGPTVHEVKLGDTAWGAAEAHLNANGGHATDTQIANLVNKMIEDNPDVLGKNPNLIFEHQKLIIDAPSLDAPQVAAAPVYNGPHHVPHPDAPHHAAPSSVAHDHGHKAAMNMLQTEALPNGTPAQVSKFLDLVTKQERVDDGLQIS
ncbi:hypothetical protein V0M98_38575 (plasmid) [Pseudomonas silesiensis]|uniref:hypothetical protein n=1 Tax=Pseudomonas silesiensis TaxID=1853130 RepID=UPI0030CDEDA7